MDNRAWAEELRVRFNDGRAGADRRAIKLPTALVFSGSSSCATIEITRDAVTANMQSDAAAFEGWAFALMRWLDVPRIRLTVERERIDPGEVGRGHFERFAFRVGRFRELLGDHLEIDPSLRALIDTSALPTATPVLNVGGAGRGYEGIPVERASESELELFLCHHPEARRRLMIGFGLKRLCRQFPVGLFDGQVSATKRIFPGGKSAIDLIGIGMDGAVHIFELKKPKNAKVGAVSELIFYVAALDQARTKKWRFAGGKPDPKANVLPEHVISAGAIKGHLLAQDFHPLVDAELLAMITSRMTRAGWQTSLDRVEVSRFTEGVY